MNNINSIGNNCTGCQGCIAVCPCNAIKPKRGMRGELLYEANGACVNCGKCINVCSAINSSFNAEPSLFYKAKTQNQEVLLNSSSGGVAYEIAKHFINKGAIVYGAAWDFETQRVQHIKVNSLNELPRLQGSKYVKSDLDKSIVSEITQILKETDKEIVFFGCPCQVSATKNVVGNRDNIYYVDLVCHGVPSHELLESQLKHITNNRIKDISFRDGLSFRLDVVDEKNVRYSINGFDNPYYVLFLTYTSLRESCYNCVYAQRRRVGDITLGDYVENKRGYSCVIASTPKGEALLNDISEEVELEKKNTDLLQSNEALNHPTKRTDKVDLFTDRYSKYGLKYAYYRTFPTYIMKRYIRKVLGDQLYDWLLRHDE